MPRASMPALEEGDVGIFDYASRDIDGIGGRLKSTPADFRVNELRADGSEVVFDDAAVEGASASRVAPGVAPGVATGVAVAELDGEEEDESADWEEEEYPGEFVKFVLRKERLDTFGALAELSEELGQPVQQKTAFFLKAAFCLSLPKCRTPKFATCPELNSKERNQTERESSFSGAQHQEHPPLTPASNPRP